MRRFFAAYAFVVLVGMLAAGYSYVSYARDADSHGESVTTSPATSTVTGIPPVSGSADVPSGLPIVSLGGVDIRVTLADTPAKRTQGLSGIPALAADEGMLFIFPQDGMHGFWMKDMHFSIDILWLSAGGEVVHIVENAAPESYPASYMPEKPARYVLEVPAGFSKAHDVRVGSTARLPR